MTKLTQTACHSSLSDGPVLAEVIDTSKRLSAAPGTVLSPVFIVGSPRSGTTLVRELLSSHPNLTFPPESHFIPAFYRAYGNPSSEHKAMALARRILEFRTVKTWGVSLTPSDFASCRTFSEVLTRLYGAWAWKCHKPRWGDKTPQYVSDMPLLLTLFPAARFLHIYRDGRDVVLSALRANFDGNLYTAATHWKAMVKTGRSDGARMPRENYLEIRYESLIAYPVITMHQVCDFLAEPFCEDVLVPSHLNPHPLSAGSWINVRAGSTDRIMIENAGKWRRQLTRAQRILFESVAGRLLRTLGYDVEGLVRRVTIVERAVWRCHQFLWYSSSRFVGIHRIHFLGSFLMLHWARIRGWYSDKVRQLT